MITISADFGYGDTKYAIETDDNNIKFGKFPTAVAKISNEKNPFGIETDNLKLNKESYKVGESALDYNVIPTRTQDFLIKYSPLLLANILKEEGIDLNKEQTININLKTGLSLLNWNLVKEYINALKEFKINNTTIKSKIELFAQGQGILFDTQTTKGYTIIVDMGLHTLDILHFKDAKPLEKCTALKFGVFNILNNIIELVKEKTGIEINEQQAKAIFLKKEIKFRRKIVDLSKEIDKIVNDYTNLVLKQIETNFSKEVELADNIVFGGGGAYYINKDIIQDENSLFYGSMFPEKPYEFSNVRGYLKESK